MPLRQLLRSIVKKQSSHWFLPLEKWREGHGSDCLIKKVNLNSIPWRERKSPKGKYHRFRRDVALAFESPKTVPKLPGQAPFEVELIRLPPRARNCPFRSHATE